MGFVKRLETKLEDRILYGEIEEPNITNRSQSFQTKSYIEGTFFASTANAVRTIYEYYYSLHDEWLDQGLFVRTDQAIMNELAYVRARNLVARLKTYSLNCTQRYNVWFYYQYYFAHEDQYICYNDRLSTVF